MKTISTEQALKQALSDMKKMSPAELRQDLAKHAGGSLAVAFRETSEFLGEFIADGHEEPCK